MPSVGPLAYPFDPTGQASTNLVSDEQQVLTAANYKDYNFVVPDFAPFFGASVVVTITDGNGVTRTLQQGLDYFPAMQYIGASRACARPIYGAISFVNLSLVGTVKLTYQTIGGDWTLDSAKLAAIAADTIYNPYTVSWEQIAQVPVVFPVIDHAWDLTDMVGMSDVVSAINSLSTIVLQASQTGISNHVSDVHNPHLVSKDQVGLGNVLNFPPATVQDALAGVSSEMYVTPLSLKAVLANFVARIAVPSTITDHVASKLNPHGVTKEQVGLGNVVDLPLVTTTDILAGKPKAAYLTLEMLYNFIAHNGGLNVTGASASAVLTAAASNLTVGGTTNVTIQLSGLNATSGYTVTLQATNPGATVTSNWLASGAAVSRTFTTDSTGGYSVSIPIVNDGTLSNGYWKFSARLVDTSSTVVTLTTTPASINLVTNPAIVLSASLLTVGAGQSSVLTAAASDFPISTSQQVKYFGTYTQTGETFQLYTDNMAVDALGRGSDSTTVTAAPQGLAGAWTIYASINGVNSNTISQSYSSTGTNPAAVLTASSANVAVGGASTISVSVTGFAPLTAYTGNITAALGGGTSSTFSVGTATFTTNASGAAVATVLFNNDGSHTSGSYTISGSFASSSSGIAATITPVTITIAASSTNPTAIFSASPLVSPVGGSVTFTGVMAGFLPNTSYVAYWTVGAGSNTTQPLLNASGQQVTTSFTTNANGAATITSTGANGVGTYTILGGLYSYGATFKTSSGTAVTVGVTPGTWTATPSTASITLSTSALSLATNTSLTYTTTASGFAPNTTFTTQWYSQWSGDTPAYSVLRNFTSVSFTTNANGTASVTTNSAGLADSLAGTYRIYATLNGVTSNTLTQVFTSSTVVSPVIGVTLNPTTVGSGSSALATYSISGLAGNTTYNLSPNYVSASPVFGGTAPTPTTYNAQSFTTNSSGTASVTVNTPTSLTSGTWVISSTLSTAAGANLTGSLGSATLTVSGSSSSATAVFTASPTTSPVGGSVTFTGTITGLSPNTAYNANFLVGVNGGALGIYYSAIGSTTQLTRSFTTNSSGAGSVSFTGGNDGRLGSATYQISARIVNASTGVDSGITATPANWTTTANPQVGLSASTYNLPTNTAEEFYISLTDFPTNATFTVTTYATWSGDTPAYGSQHTVESFQVTTNASGQASITRYSSGLADNLAGTYQFWATVNGINSNTITQTYTVGGGGTGGSSTVGGGFSIG